MLARFIASHSRHFRRFSTTLSPQFHSTPLFICRHFSTNDNGAAGNGKPTSDFWKLAQQETNLDDIFDTHNHNLKEDSTFPQQQTWQFSETANEPDGGLFEEFGGKESGASGDGLSPVPEYEPWKLEEEEKIEDLFGIEAVAPREDDGFEMETETVSPAKKLELEKEERALMDVLKGPNRAFGDLVAQSGITEDMLDSLIALKNFQDIEGLPPLTQIEDERYESNTSYSSRHEVELQKQEEASKAYVRQVDEKGRAYGTGKRKCSIARVWIQPGEGNFLINDKEYDVYFPMLDHRAALLRPFSETKTLGLWDVKCTVKGGGVTGQVDAIRLGISRALQNWEPGLRPMLKDAGLLTRDPRVVERKKPGKAKARKSFQWVKR